MSNQRLHLLDVTRGIAALAVVMSHWKHFFYSKGKLPSHVDVAEFPGYDLLWPLYRYGWIAVDYFFVVSGFVFFWLYASRIGARQIDFRSFSILRVSRLYPLHFLTLLLVAWLQWIYKGETGEYFVYQFNDVKHFALNLFMASHWGFQRGDSFNGPIWSVSVEVASYGVFFVVAYMVSNRMLRVVLPLVAAFALSASGVNPPLAKALVLFFIGGAVFEFSQVFVVRSKATAFSLIGVVAGSWGLALFAIAPEAGFPGSLGGTATAVWAQHGHVISRFYTSFWLFPLSVYVVYVSDVMKLFSVRSFAWVGDISYSSYLIHFPLQLLAVLFIKWAGSSVDVFLDWRVLVGFYFVLIVLSIAAHRCFERPAQAWLRSTLISRQRVLTNV
jgi:peptidoglycan/LPS O-acetylase OafA/YrhL